VPLAREWRADPAKEAMVQFIESLRPVPEYSQRGTVCIRCRFLLVQIAAGRWILTGDAFAGILDSSAEPCLTQAETDTLISLVTKEDPRLFAAFASFWTSCANGFPNASARAALVASLLKVCSRRLLCFRVDVDADAD
jgi:hypothetical protein